ncbi:unnamed protein product [Rhizopus stolonifer]
MIHGLVNVVLKETYPLHVQTAQEKKQNICKILMVKKYYLLFSHLLFHIEAANTSTGAYSPQTSVSTPISPFGQGDNNDFQAQNFMNTSKIESNCFESIHGLF